MKKALLLVLGVCLVVVAAAGLWFWNMMQQPLYEPGMVRAGTNLSAPLAPPSQPADANFWTVENGIKLYHFSTGRGTDVLVIHGGPGIPFARPLTGLEALDGRYKFFYYDQRGSGKSSRPIDRLASSNYYENMVSAEIRSVSE